MKWRILICLIFCLHVATLKSFAQEQLLNMAKEFMLKQDFAKAAELYQKVYELNPDDNSIATIYVEALVGLKEYKLAEKITKGLLKKNKTDIDLTLLLAKIYLTKGDDKKARKVLDDLMDEKSNNEKSVKTIATLFEKNNLIDYAIEMYERAIKKSGDPFLFAQELSVLYDKKGDFERATESLLNLAAQQPEQLESVKGSLLRLFTQKDKLETVRKKIIQRINEQGESVIYPDILSWLYIQQNDYEEAFVQIKALDIRLKEEGRRPLQFAKIASKEKKYAAALQALIYIIGLGKEKMYYNAATNEKLNTLRSQLFDNSKYTEADVARVIEGYKEYFENNPTAKNTDATVAYAALQARYANDVEGAINTLTTFVSKPNIPVLLKGRAKLDLGDYQLITGNNWESTLIYSQVDKDFKNDVLGEEARFRNAKLSYYIGDYTWAQGQLDVLKASTSELIANDALNLSVLITENIPSDSIMIPLEMFSRAELLIFQNKINDATKTLDSISGGFPQHPLMDDVLMTRATIAFKQQKFNDALEAYKQVYTNYADDILADDAIYQSAMILENQLDKKEEAQKLYEKIILDFPGSSYSGESRKAFRKLRGDVLN
jgi:tetratricopeptide (TPR) repeat protein